MEKLKEAAAHATPSTPRNAQAFVQPFLPSAIVDLLRLKRKVRREFARTGDFRIQQIYRRLSNRLHKVLTQRKQHQIDNLLENMGTDASSQFSLWRITKRFKFQASQKSAIRSPSGGWCRTSQDKAKVFASNLEERFKPLAFADANQCRLVTESLETPFQMALPADPVTLEEQKQLVSLLKSKKAPGHDLLDNRTIKILPYQALRFLVLIFNSALLEGYFPKVWKTANIILILKPGKKPTEVDSYRPISLLPSLGKIMERIPNS